MKRIAFFLMAVLLLASCKSKKPEQNISKQEISDQVFQYSLFTALANSVYDGNFTVAEVKKKGNIGLGTYNGLNGEMVVCNGKVYHCLANGTVLQPEDSKLIPFTVLKFFESDQSLEIKETTTFSEMKTMIEAELLSSNLIYAFKINATFEYLKCGSANMQGKPYVNTLSEAIADRPTFEWENISGTMVGFWYPEYVGGINLSGFHMHFISDDEQKAGHVMEFRASNLEIGIDVSSGFQLELPETGEFKNKVLDLTQGYN